MGYARVMIELGEYEYRYLYTMYTSRHFLANIADGTLFKAAMMTR